MKAKIKFYLGVWLSIFEKNTNVRTGVLVICFMIYDYHKTSLVLEESTSARRENIGKIELLADVVKILELETRCKELERENQLLKSENEKIIQLLK